MNSARISILKTVLVIIFREVSAYANETRVGNGCDIAMAHCRSFPGFQMMELCASRVDYRLSYKRHQKHLISAFMLNCTQKPSVWAQRERVFIANASLI